MERVPTSMQRSSATGDHAAEPKRNRWAAAGQAVLNPALQKEQSFPNSMGRSHFPRCDVHPCRAKRKVLVEDKTCVWLASSLMQVAAVVCQA